MTDIVLAYINFILSFFALFAIVILVILAIAGYLKSKGYLTELIHLGFISFSVLLGIYEIGQIVAQSYSINGIAFEQGTIFDMFALMAAMLMFSVTLVKNRLKNV